MISGGRKCGERKLGVLKEFFLGWGRGEGGDSRRALLLRDGIPMLGFFYLCCGFGLEGGGED